jgi:hypothetical protein
MSKFKRGIDALIGAQPSFFKGIAHLFDFSQSFSLALGSRLLARNDDFSADWHALSNDMQCAVRQYVKEREGAVERQTAKQANQ